MYRAMRMIRGERWEMAGEYDPSDLVAGLRLFQNRGWKLHLETVNLDPEIAKLYEALQVKPDLYVSPCLDVLDRTATHHKHDFALDHKVLDVLEGLAGRLYHAEYAHCLLVHDKHVLIDASAFVDGPLLVSSRIPEPEVRKFAQLLKKTYELCPV